MENEKDKINIRDLDDAFLERDLRKIENEVKSKAGFTVAVAVTIIYMIISTLFYGMFAYRGGDPDIGVNGIFIDTVVISFILYGVTHNEKNNRWMSVVFGTLLFLCGDILIKNTMLYPFITQLLGMR